MVWIHLTNFLYKKVTAICTLTNAEYSQEQASTLKFDFH